MVDVLGYIYLAGFVIVAIFICIGNEKYGSNDPALFHAALWPVFAIGIAGAWVAYLLTPTDKEGGA